MEPVGTDDSEEPDSEEADAEEADAEELFEEEPRRNGVGGR
jgi:hypothetical protein